MGLEKSRYINKDGEHIIVLLEDVGTSRKSYTIANLDSGVAHTDFSDRSVGIALDNLKADNWTISDTVDSKKLADKIEDEINRMGDEFGTDPSLYLEHRAEPADRSMHAGLAKGMTDTARNFYQIYDFGYLDSHGMSKVSVRVNYSDMVQDRYSLRVSDDDTPFVGVKGTDVIEYLGGSKWKFIKHSEGKKAER